jgi:hypothetical protein
MSESANVLYSHSPSGDVWEYDQAFNSTGMWPGFSQKEQSHMKKNLCRNESFT